jgi:hypothetical protein
MRSKPETFAIYAEKCMWRAAAVDGRRLKSLFVDLAYQWRELAVTVQLLDADAKERDDFFAQRERGEKKTVANFVANVASSSAIALRRRVWRVAGWDNLVVFITTQAT